MLFLFRHFDQIERCDWSERARFVTRFSALIGDTRSTPMSERALGFRAMALGLDPELQLVLARQIAAGVSASVGARGERAAVRRSQNGAERRIRVAYLSPYFGMYPTGLLTQSLFSWHDRARFEVFGYALGGDDGSALRRKIVAGFDRFVDLDDAAAARAIADDKVDILIDLMGYADRSRPGILARRPAPLQISWLEYIATTGDDWIDYLITDRICVPPESSAYFSEAVIRVPDGRCPCSYADDTPPTPPSRQALGLPASGMILGALHNAYKIDPQIFSIWMRFLLARTDAVLYLLDVNPAVRANLAADARACGVDPQRLLFAPRLPHAEHLARLVHVDLVLDTAQCNGGTTTADALVAGVPVLTCLGRTIAQRMAASMLISASLPDLALLGDAARLRELRRRLGAARSTAPFFAPRRWLRGYERALCVAWQKHCAGEAPRSFEVDA